MQKIRLHYFGDDAGDRDGKKMGVSTSSRGNYFGAPFVDYYPELNNNTEVELVHPPKYASSGSFEKFGFDEKNDPRASLAAQYGSCSFV